MNDLIVHIQYLLPRKKTVTIPFIGTLYLTRIPARFDYNSKSLYPPYTKIQFKKLFDQTEYLVLRDSYKRKLGVSYEEAETLVSDAARHLAERIKKGIKVKISDYGILTSDESGKIDFKSINSPWKNF